MKESFLAFAALLFYLSPFANGQQGTPAATAAPAQAAPASSQTRVVLNQRPAPGSANLVPGTRIQLDVVVTDKSGRPIAGINTFQLQYRSNRWNMRFKTIPIDRPATMARLDRA